MINSCVDIFSSKARKSSTEMEKAKNIIIEKISTRDDHTLGDWAACSRFQCKITVIRTEKRM